jgi:thymidine phosphorylase
MKDEQSARNLAETMVSIGAAHGTKVVATLTAMDQPLGREVGNANEISESLAVLAGGGPEDVVALTYSLGADMLLLGGAASDRDEAVARLEQVVASGAAMEKFQEIIVAQDGNPAVTENPGLLPVAPEVYELTATEAGFVTTCNARDIGVAGVRLGAGRERKEDDVDHGVGITLLAKVGDEVGSGDVLARIRYRDPEKLDGALPLLQRAYQIGDQPAELQLFIGHID